MITAEAFEELQEQAETEIDTPEGRGMLVYKGSACAFARRAPTARVMKPGALPSRALIAFAITLSLLSGSASATLLNLAPQQTLYQFPDANIQFIGLSYDFNTKLFSAVGYYATIETDGLPGEEYFLDGNGTAVMYLNCYVDGLGNLIGVQSPDSFQLWDDAWEANSPYGNATNNPGAPFLQGRISAFGWQETSGHRLFEFYIESITGDGSDPAWFGNGKKGLSLDTGDAVAFNGVWDHSWSSSGIGQADLFNVPEPAGAAMALMGCVVIVILGRKLRGVRFWSPRC